MDILVEVSHDKLFESCARRSPRGPKKCKLMIHHLMLVSKCADLVFLGASYY